MPEKPYKSSKSTSPPNKVESQVDHVESDASKVQKQILSEFKKANAEKHSSISSLGGVVGLPRKKTRFEVPPQGHSAKLESAFKQYEEDRVEQEKEEEDDVEVKVNEEEEEGEYYGLSRSSFLPGITDFQNAKPSRSDASIPRTREAAGSGSQLGGSVQDFSRNRYPQDLNRYLQDAYRYLREVKPSHSDDSGSRTWEAEEPGATGGQLGARVESGRPNETRKPEPQPAKDNHSGDSELRTLETMGIGGTSGQLGARFKSGGTPTGKPGPLFAKPSPSSDSELRLFGPGGTGGQLGAKATSASFTEKPARKPEPPSSRSEVHRESPVKGVKGPVASNKDTSQAPNKP